MKFLHAWAFVAAATLAGCGGGGGDAVETQSSTPDSPAAATPPSGSTSTGSTAGASADLCGTAVSVADILAKLNAARSVARGCGFATYAAAPALAWNAKLAIAAQAHSLDMASHSLFSHTGSDGGSVAERASAAGYAWSMLGENISGGQAGADDAIAIWLSSPAHCANLMNPGYKDVALACSASPGSAHLRYWTLVLGS